MEQPGAAAAAGGGEEPGGGRSTKRSAGNRAANEEETKNKPKLVSAPGIALPSTRGRGPPPKADGDLAGQLREPLGERPRVGDGRAPPSRLTPSPSRPPGRQSGEQEGPTPTWGDPESGRGAVVGLNSWAPAVCTRCHPLPSPVSLVGFCP